MNLKKLCTLVLCTFLVTLIFSGVGKSAPEKMLNVYYLEYGGLKIDIRAPVKAYNGDNITVSVKTEAVVSQIFIKYIKIDLFGRVDAATEIYLDQITHLTNSSLSSYETQYDVAIPSNLSPGLTYGVISCEWEFMGSPQKIPSSGFATHQSLVQNYTTIESTLEGEVYSTRNLLYVFVATTVVTSITVVVLLMRKPQRVWH
jgi:hypothetical protein